MQEPASQKSCTECKVTKPLADFESRTNRLSGIGSQCKVCRRDYERQRRSKRPGISAGWRNAYLKRTYGITLKDELALWDAQDSKCAICEKTLTTATRQIDHCHKTGRVRGLLCTPCNLLVAWIENSNHRLTPRALKYLASYDA